ncbi:MAG: dTDP-glucose 4,6-dehydratase [Candidatus Micrarchaeota archaeon]
MATGYSRALITGGAGFIGSNFIRHMLLAHPELKIVNLDKLTYAGNPENLAGFESNKNYSFFKGDICDSKAVARALKDCDLVINFAAETHVDRSISSAGDFITSNFYGVYNLLEQSRKSGIKRFVQISTDEVYGSIKNGSSKEGDAVLPNSPYSASKASADLLCRSYFVTYGLPVIITRSSNNFGPYQHPEKLIPKFITNTMQNIPLPLYGDGLNVRDWIYVEDNCSGIETAALKGKPGEIYNIGGGNERANIDITKLILARLKKPDSLIKRVPDRLGHDRRYSIDSSKLSSIGWKPKHSFEQAMEKTVAWYLENRKWWEKLV